MFSVFNMFNKDSIQSSLEQQAREFSSTALYQEAIAAYLLLESISSKNEKVNVKYLDCIAKLFEVIECLPKSLRYLKLIVYENSCGNYFGIGGDREKYKEEIQKRIGRVINKIKIRSANQDGGKKKKLGYKKMYREIRDYKLISELQNMAIKKYKEGAYLIARYCFLLLDFYALATKGKRNVANLFLLGECMYELGYHSEAKRCYEQTQKELRSKNFLGVENELDGYNEKLKKKTSLIENMEFDPFLGEVQLKKMGDSFKIKITREDIKSKNTILHKIMCIKEEKNMLPTMVCLRYPDQIEITKNILGETPLDIAIKDKNINILHLITLPFEKIEARKIWNHWVHNAFEFSGLFDFSRMGLTYGRITLLAKFLSLFPSVLELNLSHNDLEKKHIDLLNDYFLKYNRTLKKIDISHNHITYNGLIPLLEYIKNRGRNFPFELNLTHNWVHSDKFLLKSKLREIVEHTKVATVDISLNHIMMESKKLSKFNAVFKTKQSDACSIIRPQEKITYNNWVIFALRKGQSSDPEHAMIIIEGMRKDGQLFIEMSHFVPQKDGYITGTITKTKGEVIINDYSPHRTFVQARSYEYNYCKVKRCVAETLQKCIREDIAQQENGIFQDYIKTGGGSSHKGAYNCFTWVVSKLKQVELYLDESRWLSLTSWNIYGNEKKIKEKAEDDMDQALIKCLLM